MNEEQSLKLSLPQAMSKLSTACEDACSLAIAKPPLSSPEAKKILALLLRRQNEALSLLGSVRGSVEEAPAPSPSVQKCSLIRRYLTVQDRPALRLIFCMLLLSGSILSAFVPFAWLLPLGLSAGLTVHSVRQILQQGKTAAELPKAACKLYMMPAAADSYALQSQNGLVQDTEDILNLFAGKALDAGTQTEQDMAELYQDIYNLSQLHPQELRPILDRQQQLLWKIGLEAVSYTPETAAAFDTEIADCPSQMLYPAVRKIKNKLTVRKGSCILDMNDPCRGSQGIKTEAST